jgi:ATP-binding protein involved in chromosome partitioning
VEPVEPPIAIKRQNDEQKLLIQWRDGSEFRLPLVPLRAECCCAHCVDEMTGRRLIEVSAIAPDITIDEMQLVGNYAVKLFWSDGHNTGLYTWALLQKLCGQLAAT